MRQALAIAARDLRERTFVFITAAVVALMPFGIMLARQAYDRTTVILLGGLIAAVAVTFGVATVVGASMIGRDLTDRRASFYFSKPVPASAIWFGKLGAAIVTVVLTFAIIFVPAFVFARSAWQGMLGASAFLLVRSILVAAVILVLLAHAISTVVRSHSALIAVDLILATVYGFVVWFLVVPFLINFAHHVLLTMVEVGAFAVPIAIAGAGAWQLSRGRTDIRRSHREFSRALWSCLAVVLLGLGLYGGFIVSASPRDLKNVTALGSPRGDWLAVSGTARDDYQPTFLVNAANGDYRSTGPLRFRGVQFTRRGDAAIEAWPVVERFRLTPRVRLAVQILGREPYEIQTGVTTSFFGPFTVLSDNLQSMANFDGNIVSVYHVASHALLASARVPFGDTVRMFFVSPQLLRIYAATLPRRSAMAPPPEDVRIYEFNVATRQMQQTGHLSYPAYFVQAMRVSGDGATLVVTASGRARILDARTGALRTTIPVGKWGQPVTLLSNGWIAFVDFTTDALVRIFDANGALVRDIPVGAAAGRTMTGGGVRELVPGRKLLVSIRHAVAGRPAAGNDLCVVDVQTGKFERIEHNVSAGAQTVNSDPRMPEPLASDTVIIDAMGTLWRWNPLTGAKSKIL